MSGATSTATASPTSSSARRKLATAGTRAHLPRQRRVVADDPSTALTGLDSSDAFGTAVSVVGDVSGDSFADMVVVASGSAAATSTSATPAACRPAGGSFYAATGATVAGAGDVDGDGLAGSSSAPGGASVYHWNGTLATMVANLTPPASAGPLFGASVSGVGDVNADGFADVVVGALSADGARGHVLRLLRERREPPDRVPATSLLRHRDGLRRGARPARSPARRRARGDGPAGVASPAETAPVTPPWAAMTLAVLREVQPRASGGGPQGRSGLGRRVNLVERDLAAQVGEVEAPSRATAVIHGPFAAAGDARRSGWVGRWGAHVAQRGDAAVVLELRPRS